MSHPTAYNILSQWGIKVDDLESMMKAYEEEDKSIEESAQEWIEEEITLSTRRHSAGIF